MADTQPVFLFGALRSGTTLLRLMLLNHPDIHSPDEADFLFDYLTPDPASPGGWHCDTEALSRNVFFRDCNVPLPEGVQGVDLIHALVDVLAAKAPGSVLCLDIHRNADLASKIFPDAKFLHLLRDPRDVARSSVDMGWAGNSYFGVDHWVGTEAGWEEASIAPDRVLTVRFEELVCDLEAELSRISDFFGLPFAPEMLLYHEHSTYGPPDPRMASKWQRKKGTREIALIEGRAGPLMEARGYAPSGPPAVPGGLEQMKLVAGHRFGRWSYNVRRYGLGLFMSHHLARALRLRGWADKLAARQEAIRVSNFK